MSHFARRYSYVTPLAKAEADKRGQYDPREAKDFYLPGFAQRLRTGESVFEKWRGPASRSKTFCNRYGRPSRMRGGGQSSAVILVASLRRGAAWRISIGCMTGPRRAYDEHERSLCPVNRN